ncbi:hypothetical protein KSP40_PGU001200 [Platanthera guangdongensis]|uniref:Uncharacterized protein n=1 Tax=Platanthera guangdongensis TaxID=2320717 RepID=A0ABR2N3I1_9ASPA
MDQRTTPILERFHTMLRDWEDELREEDGGDKTPPLDGHEIVRMYEDFLTELTFNLKPIITDLTIIAGEQREHARGIAKAVCYRIDEVWASILCGLLSIPRYGTLGFWLLVCNPNI